MSACPKCGTWESTVDQSRATNTGWRIRDRNCKSCLHQWKTYEIADRDLNIPANSRFVVYKKIPRRLK